MKLYTRTGDDGSTGLFGGQRVLKNHLRVRAYGEVDELNACIGLACSTKLGQTAVPPRILEILTILQSRLFDLGADLATPSDSKHEGKIHRLEAALVSDAEQWIDEIDSQNSPIKAFILPGGCELAARLHLARTVCRRAERAMITLAQSEPVNPHAIVFINRVSDLLFALARLANAAAGVQDVEWHPE